ncbi:MAG TPA: toll/interleukin-1 receptor domain-containing protein [Bacteroidales bacterium]|nr:toll/interleukin-1 receptor domain-containing protein [Bacteroidales bacterium]
MKKTKIFVSYSHQNEEWISEEGKYKLIPWLAKQLDADAEMWTDHALKKLIGEEYTSFIKKRILESDIVILLISQDFVSSQFIMDVELPLIKQQYKNEKIKIIPLLITDLTKKGKEKISWIFDLQTYPNDTKPLIDFADNDSGWARIKVEILEGVENKIDELRNVRSGQTEKTNEPAYTNPPVNKAEKTPPLKGNYDAANARQQTSSIKTPVAGFPKWIKSIIIAAGIIVFILFPVKILKSCVHNTSRIPQEETTTHQIDSLLHEDENSVNDAAADTVALFPN